MCTRLLLKTRKVLLSIMLILLVGLLLTSCISAATVTFEYELQGQTQNDDPDYDTCHDAEEGTHYETTSPLQVFNSYDRGAYLIGRGHLCVDIDSFPDYYIIDWINMSLYITSESTADDFAHSVMVSWHDGSWAQDITDYGLSSWLGDTFGLGDFDGSSTGWVYNNLTESEILDLDEYIYAESPIYLSFRYGDDALDLAPSGVNYIYYDTSTNIGNMTIGYHVIEPEESPFDGGSNYGWSMMSNPSDFVVPISECYVRNATNNYTWANAVTNGILVNWVYIWDEVGKYYTFTNNFNGSLGHWLYWYESGYEIWHENWSAVGNATGECVVDEDEYLFIAGLELDPETQMFIVMLFLWWVILKISRTYVFIPFFFGLLQLVLVGVYYVLLDPGGFVQILLLCGFFFFLLGIYKTYKGLEV